MIKLIIFDLWSTLEYKRHKKGTVEWIYEKLARKHSLRKVRKTFEKTFHMHKSDSFEKDYKKMFDILQIKHDHIIIKKNALYRRKIESESSLYKYSVPLLRTLNKKRYKVALLSNITHFHGILIKKSILKKYIDKFFFSYELGSIKPDKKNFRAVLSYFKVKPSETIMIGDNYKDDIVPSKELGINAIHFRNGKKLKRKLKKIGVL
ncbi:hypothetical protein CEE44_01980 [Candidatus Woesearchaeota archaeon B3_Woes]|nr:MAG: hypothetical protein CEE44_01980 [Candidatus Woesearchaeota archaeon B3_Woes]